MFSKSGNLVNPEDYFNNALTEKPSLTQSLSSDFAAGFATPGAADIDLQNYFSNQQAPNPDRELLAAVQQQDENPNIGWAQQGADYVSNLIGYALNPQSIALGYVGGVLAKPISAGLGALAPRIAATPITDILSQKVSKYLPEKALESTIGDIGNKSLGAFLGVSGAMLPSSIEENYNPQTNDISWGGVAKSSMAMGGIGIGISSVPFMLGIIGRRIKGVAETAATAPEGVEPEGENIPGNENVSTEATAPNVPQEYIDWHNDYMKAKDNPSDIKLMNKVMSDAAELAEKEGFTVDRKSNSIHVPVLTDGDINNLKGALVEQIESGHLDDDYRNALSEFVTNARTSEHVGNDKLMDGLQGYMDFVRDKFDAMDDKLAESDKAVADSLKYTVKDNLFISQSELFKTLKQAGFEESHMNAIPATFPSNIEKIIKADTNINRLKEKLKTNDNVKVRKRIAQLEKSKPDLLSPKNELMDIRGKLLEKAELSPSFQFSTEYARLNDLARFWEPAKKLLDRVNLQHEYEKQNAFYNIIGNIVRRREENITSPAKNSDVIDYLLKKINDSQVIKNDAENIAGVKTKEAIDNDIESAQKIPSDIDKVVAANDDAVKKQSSSNVKADYEEAMDKFNEFRESKDVFSKLISCVTGVINGL